MQASSLGNGREQTLFRRASTHQCRLLQQPVEMSHFWSSVAEKQLSPQHWIKHQSGGGCSDKGNRGWGSNTVTSNVAFVLPPGGLRQHFCAACVGQGDHASNGSSRCQTFAGTLRWTETFLALVVFPYMLLKAWTLGCEHQRPFAKGRKPERRGHPVHE